MTEGRAALYTKKPVTITAHQWPGDVAGLPSEFALAISSFTLGGSAKIETLEGIMEARVGDWIIKGIKGEFYPCKPDIFEATYSAALPKADAADAKKATLDEWPADFNPRMGIGPTQEDIFVWFYKHRETVYEVLKAALPKADTATTPDGG